MENDLISRSALRTLAYHVTDNIIGVERCVVDWEDIEDTPAVDAVEVVYCGECRHADYEDITGWLWCNEWQCASNCGGYCHKGERGAEDG